MGITKMVIDGLVKDMIVHSLQNYLQTQGWINEQSDAWCSAYNLLSLPTKVVSLLGVI